jgi:hypothetical protein
VFVRACLADAAPAARWDAPFDEELYAAELLWRLPLQWPGLDRTVLEVLLRARAGASLRSPGDAGTRELLRGLAAVLPIEPAFYAGAEDNPRTGGPPHSGLIEEPPFIVPRPRARVAARADPRVHLVLKAPVAAYQLGFLSRCFPRARLKLVHLLRNPAAAINGLIDGWRHWGFFSRDVRGLGAELAIAGYTTRDEWSRCFWKFDLPPGWRDHVCADLHEVCAFQWRSAHEHVLRFRSEHPEVDCCEIRFEDLISGSLLRERALGGLAAFLGVRPFEVGAGAAPAEVVMATAPPERGRWRRRSRQLAPLVTDGPCAEVAVRLGYDPREMEEWP